METVVMPDDLADTLIHQLKMSAAADSIFMHITLHRAPGGRALGREPTNLEFDMFGTYNSQKIAPPTRY